MREVMSKQEMEERSAPTRPSLWTGLTEIDSYNLFVSRLPPHDFSSPLAREDGLLPSPSSRPWGA